MDRSFRAPALALTFALAAACTDVDPAPDTGAAEGALGGGAQAHQGEDLFSEPFAGTNGRACATCHVEAEHFALTPGDVAARLAADPGDPLFQRLDADDPQAAVPTYEHVRAGLVRVTLPLAANLDVVDPAGHVITNASRTIDVWRAVPTVENTAYTAPYQLDGRFATLQVQASAALHAHSLIDHEPAGADLDAIAAFERTVFSDPVARRVARAIAAGEDPEDVERHFPPRSDEAAGQALFARACAPCHGGATQLVTAPAIHDQLHPVLNADGSVDVVFGPDGQILPAHVHTGLVGHPQLNIGISFGTFLTQVGALPNPTGVGFPRYRLRFYTDATRTTTLMDLPPLPPAIGPTGAPQLFSVDPGLAATTGDILDWEAFEVPQLRGIARTAPYFHDNFAPDLAAVVDTYSRFILAAVPQLGLPLAHPPEAPGLPPEALSPTEKAQLVAFLRQL